MPDVYKKYTNGLGKGRRYTKQYKKVNINVRKAVMKGDFDSLAKLEIF